MNDMYIYNIYVFEMGHFVTRFCFDWFFFSRPSIFSFNGKDDPEKRSFSNREAQLGFWGFGILDEKLRWIRNTYTKMQGYKGY